MTWHLFDNAVYVNGQRTADPRSLHPLAVEDAIAEDQRPKLERYGKTLFTVLRPAQYIDFRDHGAWCGLG
jgi:Mg2+ and Co2+ transporter CorA